MYYNRKNYDYNNNDFEYEDYDIFADLIYEEEYLDSYDYLDIPCFD